jgi:hypothetical protein
VSTLLVCVVDGSCSVSFDENYGLAATQSLKNKDIPEGGAKGTILPSLGASPRLCFEKYVDVSHRVLGGSFGGA